MGHREEPAPSVSHLEPADDRLTRVLHAVGDALAGDGAAAERAGATDAAHRLAAATTAALAASLGGSVVLWGLDATEAAVATAAAADPDADTSGILARALGDPEGLPIQGLLGKAVVTGSVVQLDSATWRQVAEWRDLEALALLEGSGPVSVTVLPLRTGQSTLGALALVRPSGDGVLTESDVTALRDVADRLALVFANERLQQRALDETRGRRSAEEALRSGEARLRAVGRAGPVLLFALDAEGVFTLMDGGLLLEFGQLPGTFVGRDFFAVYRDHPALLALARRVLDGEVLRRVPVPFEGRDLEAWVVPLHSQSGERDGAAGIVVDVSGRVAAERAVVDAARRQAALVEHASDVIVVLDADARLQYVNPGAGRVLGAEWEVGEILDFVTMIHPDDRERVVAHIRQAARTPGAAPPVEYRIHHGDGTWRTVEVIGNNRLDDPAIQGFVVTLRDVTERRRDEERLRANAARQAALADLGRWALVGLALTSLIEDAVGVLAEQLDVDFVHVFEALPDQSFVSMTASRGHANAGPELLSTEPTSSPVSYALTTQEPVVCGDLSLEERFEIPDLWARAQALSVVEIPIPGPDSPVGVLGVGRRVAEELPEEDVNFVVAVANVLAAAAARHRAETAIREQALRDPLTGLPNRLVLADHSAGAAAPRSAELSGVDRMVLVLDIDRFKEINDTLGHPLGDLVLREVARRLRELGEPVELVARLGGDEFAVVASCPPSQGEGDAGDDFEAMAARLLEAVSGAIDAGGVRLRLRASVGVATPDVGEDGAPLGIAALLRRAEVAMYQAKAERRGVRRYSDDLERSSVSRLALASELADAVDRGELRLDYQPKVDATTGAVTGVEALVRWRHPTRGLLLPDVFVPLAEQTGTIRELTTWVLAKALSECAQWQRLGHLVPVAINLSAATVHDPELLATVTAAVERSGLPPGSVELEITESAVMLDPDGALRSLEQLVAHGMRLSLDDFGTGYSSLSYLQRLPVTAVKIDKSFVEPLLRDDTARAIVHSVIELAHSLHLSVIAEGVDSAAVLAQLTGLGCDAVQGFHVAVPMSPQRLEQWMEAHQAGVRPGTT